MKIPIENSMPKAYIHDGKKLTPLTPEEAYSLDKGDKVKFIGPSKYAIFHYLGRRVFSLQDKPKCTTSSNGKITVAVSYFGTGHILAHYHWALVERGNRYGLEFNRAKRLLPVNLKGFKRDLQRLVKRTQDKIDKSLKDLPLHLKLEVFKTRSESDQILYDFLYKDLEVVLGLREDVEHAT